jgi:hypothetical protein
MKTTLILCIALFAFTTITNAQCFREDTFEAIDDPDQYPVSGTATLLFNTDGTKQVIFGNDFATVQGLELRVYLSSTPRLNQGGSELEVSTMPLQDDNGGMDTNDPITGMKTFEVPSTVTLSDYDYIIIQCVMADVLWGRADLGANAGADCDTLSTENNLIEQLSIIPNPARDHFRLQGINTTVQISIFDTLGKKVLSTQTSENEAIDISTLQTGLYLISVTTEGQKATQKLIIQ